MLYAEYAFYVNSRKGNMLPITEVMRQKGFRSVYLFSEEDAKSIIANGHSRNMGQYIPYANELFIDLDDHNYIDEALSNLDKLGWRYTCYLSGSKGAHCHIPHNISCGYGLPALHLSLAQQVHPKADTSLYRMGSLFRLPGTIHQKTGKSKQLLRTGGESTLILPWTVEGAKPVIEFKEYKGTDGSDSELALSLHALLKSLNNPPPQGKRTQNLWAVAKGLHQGGLGINTVKGLIDALNASWGNDSKDDETIMRVLQDCQRKAR